MLDENLSCLLDESDDECVKKNKLKNKKKELDPIRKDIRSESHTNLSNSVLNFNIRNIKNLDNFFKSTNSENANVKNSNNNQDAVNYRNYATYLHSNDNPSFSEDENNQERRTSAIKYVQDRHPHTIDYELVRHPHTIRYEQDRHPHTISYEQERYPHTTNYEQDRKKSVTNYEQDRKKSVTNYEQPRKKSHEQLRKNSSINKLGVNNENAGNGEISEGVSYSYNHTLLNKNEAKQNIRAKEKIILHPPPVKDLSSSIKEKITNSCKFKKNHNEKIQNEGKKRKNFICKEYLLKEKSKEDMMVVTTCNEGKKFSETNFYKEYFITNRINNDETLQEKQIYNNSIITDKFNNSNNCNIYNDMENDAPIIAHDMKKDKCISNIKNNENLNVQVDHNINEISNRSANYNNPSTDNELLIKEKCKGTNIPLLKGDTTESTMLRRYPLKLASIRGNSIGTNTSLNINLPSSSTCMESTELELKIRKNKSQKRKELIYYFSFIKYNSWVKALQILDLPLDPFHLSINAHKYIAANHFNNKCTANNPSNHKSFLYKYNIHNILNNKQFSNYRIERMIIIVKSIRCRSHGFFIVAMDPSGHMPASVHKEVEKEYKKYIDVGSTLILKDVTVFETIDNFPYLIITLRSLVRVIKAEETDYATMERIYNRMYQ
ncbi:conserved Plasmodium protein, unknown function [Plasmodium malariae]|uniref:Homologous recombination OB-fold protein OB-fold domain-containing protein n=1 Tax=Plasmodium malariae TaxID=5858 RepID=A0A1A8W397_PLAMA|nr:conserved Plasmodium protein, unknown function [Plasmodium malariae]